MVTGGASGIGESIVHAVLPRERRCVADIRENVGKRLVERLIGICHNDVAVEEDAKCTVDLAVEKYGTLDVVADLCFPCLEILEHRSKQGDTNSSRSNYKCRSKE